MYLNITSRGLLAYKAPAEGREILDKIMENTSFVYKSEPLQVETEVQHEEILAAESIEIQSLDLTPKSSPEPETPKEEEIQPSEFLYSFKLFLSEAH